MSVPCHWCRGSGLASDGVSQCQICNGSRVIEVGPGEACGLCGGTGRAPAMIIEDRGFGYPSGRITFETVCPACLGTCKEHPVDDDIKSYLDLVAHDVKLSACEFRIKELERRLRCQNAMFQTFLAGLARSLPCVPGMFQDFKEAYDETERTDNQSSEACPKCD